MSDSICSASVQTESRPIVWLHGEIRTPPFSRAARLEAGFMLRQLQEGAALAMPHARPMPSIGRGCWELRVRDVGHNWRIFYRADSDALVVLAVHDKKSERSLKTILETCRARLRSYDAALGREQ